jgi:hypothetical protein
MFISISFSLRINQVPPGTFGIVFTDVFLRNLVATNVPIHVSVYQLIVCIGLSEVQARMRYVREGEDCARNDKTPHGDAEGSAEEHRRNRHIVTDGTMCYSDKPVSDGICLFLSGPSVTAEKKY